MTTGKQDNLRVTRTNDALLHIKCCLFAGDHETHEAVNKAARQYSNLQNMKW